jgi:hypothetical protein
MKTKRSEHRLFGNSFPLSLVRRPVRIEPVSLAELRRRLHAATAIHSFWGHPETLPIAEKLIGCPLGAAPSRPALRLNEDFLPTLNGRVFDECWILTPAYPVGYRPAIGGGAPAVSDNWLALRIWWEEKSAKENTEP